MFLKLFQNSKPWAIAFAQMKAKLIIFSLLTHCCHSHNYTPLFSLKLQQKIPLKETMIIFTDVSSRGRIAVLLVVKNMQCKLSHPQLKELSCKLLQWCSSFLQTMHFIYVLTAITFLKLFRY